MRFSRDVFKFCCLIPAIAGGLLTCSGRKQAAPPASPVVSEAARPEEPAADGGSRDVAPLSEEEWFRSATIAELQANLSDVHFDYDRDELRSDARASIQKNHEWLAKPHNTLRIELEGHCDERGTEAYNLALGDRRAVAVEGYLRSLGFPHDRLRTISYGKERPQCREWEEPCWWRNRRVHFRVVSKDAQGIGR